MAENRVSKRFSLVLIKPSHYDDDGYVIQWYRSAFPSNTLAVLYGLALHCHEYRILGEDVEIEITAMDEANTRIRPDQIERLIGEGPGLVALVGVQSNQFPRALDIARPLRAAGIQVCMGGFHISGCMAMLPEMPAELKEALDLGITLFVGEAEGRLELLLRDAWHRELKPIYNYLHDPPSLEGRPFPILPVTRIKRTSGKLASFEAGRGCPFQCSFCTIINVQGRATRQRSADDVESIVRRNLAQGINRFFITDDNFARNREWENIFDRLIAMREHEKLNIKFVLQVDARCHRIPGFIEKAGRAGVTRVFIGIESVRPDRLHSAKKLQNNIAEYRHMLLEWKRVGATIIAGYILGFPDDTPETIREDVRLIQRELPIDLVEFSCLTPMPGSEDHQRVWREKVPLEPDLNMYDLEHVTTPHAKMTRAEWQKAYRDAWDAYYTPEHFATVLRRNATTGRYHGGNLPLLMTWFYHYCFRLEKLHPVQGGYGRRKYRNDRRPTLPKESRRLFYSAHIADRCRKMAGHFRLAQLIWQYGRLLRRLRKDTIARSCMDPALQSSCDDPGRVEN